MRRMATRMQKKEHWGQVVPIEDAQRIVDLQSSIVRLPCVCRSLNTGKEARYCFGVGAEPTGIVSKYPDYAFEAMEKVEAKKLLRNCLGPTRASAESTGWQRATGPSFQSLLRNARGAGSV